MSARLRFLAVSSRVAAIWLATLAGCIVEPAQEVGSGSAAAITPVTWTNLDEVTAAGNDLTKSSSNRDWYAGASSAERFSRDGYLEFTTGENTSNKMVGLGRYYNGPYYSGFPFAIQLTAGGTVAVREYGDLRASAGPYAAGDLFRIQVADGLVTYWRNGEHLYTSAQTPPSSHIAEAVLKTPEATVLDAVLETDMFWTGLAGAPPNYLMVDGRQLAKAVTPEGWSAGARSIQSLGVDGYAEFTTGENTTAKMAGLSNGDDDTSYQDIDFAIYLRADGNVEIREGGLQRGTFGSYQAGDVFRVEASGGVVTYARNGTVFYTSKRTPTFPLLLDTSLRTAGATLEAIRLVEIPGPAVVFDNPGGAFVWTPTFYSDDYREQGAFLDLRRPASQQTGEPSRSGIEFFKRSTEPLSTAGGFFFRSWHDPEGPPRGASFAAGDDFFRPDSYGEGMVFTPPQVKNPGDAVGAHDHWISGEPLFFSQRVGVQTAHFQDPASDSPPTEVWFTSGIVGVRFRISGAYHYGFVELAWDEAGGDLQSLYVPVRWGYNPVPNQPVLIPP